MRPPWGERVTPVAVAGVLELQPLRVRTDHSTIRVSRASRRVPIASADEHDHARLSERGYLAQRLLQREIALRRGEQREDVGLERTPLDEREPQHVREREQDDPQPAQREPAAQTRGKRYSSSRASSGCIAAAPVAMPEKTMTVTSPPAS